MRIPGRDIRKNNGRRQTLNRVAAAALRHNVQDLVQEQEQEQEQEREQEPEQQEPLSSHPPSPSSPLLESAAEPMLQTKQLQQLPQEQ